jgi:AraC family ethanolamine operon transcriptional activator
MTEHATSVQIAEVCVRHAASVRYQRVTLRALCDVSAASERRVRDAFYECFGVSPTAHLRALALEEARRSLIEQPDARDAVTRAACDFGFWHLSRFAGQYRRLFGEAPSATVMRVRHGGSVAALD